MNHNWDGWIFKVWEVPAHQLDLFLTALNINFDMPEPSYIFQEKRDGEYFYKITYCKDCVGPWIRFGNGWPEKIEEFIRGMK